MLHLVLEQLQLQLVAQQQVTQLLATRLAILLVILQVILIIQLGRLLPGLVNLLMLSLRQLLAEIKPFGLARPALLEPQLRLLAVGLTRLVPLVSIPPLLMPVLIMELLAVLAPA